MPRKPHPLPPASFDVELYLRSLPASSLPPALQKSFWEAQRAKQTYLQESGELWHTWRVQEVLGRVFMTVRSHLTLCVDSIDRASPLSDEQRKLLQSTLDGIITELRDLVVDALADWDGAGDRQALFEGDDDVSSVLQGLDEDDDGL
jgi:hypothetical protein